jgi:hypothetical protein
MARPSPRQSITMMHMVGGLSQLDLGTTMELQKYDGGPARPSTLREPGLPSRGTPHLLGTPDFFSATAERYRGVRALPLPLFYEIVDDVAVIKGLYTDQINHGPAQPAAHRLLATAESGLGSSTTRQRQ